MVEYRRRHTHEKNEIRLVTTLQRGVVWMTYNEVFTLLLMLIALIDLVVKIIRKEK